MVLNKTNTRQFIHLKLRFKLCSKHEPMPDKKGSGDDLVFF